MRPDIEKKLCNHAIKVIHGSPARKKKNVLMNLLSMMSLER